MSYKKRNILLFVTLAVLVLAGTGYYWYNKPAVDIKDAAGLKVSATDLYKIFARDSLEAKRTYTNKILEVSGTVTQVSANQRRQTIVLLHTNIEGASINCTMEDSTAIIKTGQPVNIKGICSGIGEGNADMGIMADVYLVRCYVQAVH